MGGIGILSEEGRKRVREASHVLGV
jgi:hypothetical protein